MRSAARSVRRPPAGLGHEVDVYLPWYRGLGAAGELTPLELRVPVGGPDGDARATRS